MAKKAIPQAQSPEPAETEKRKLAEEKKQLKAERKTARKRAKEIAKKEEELDEGEGGGFMTFMATVFIVAVWLAVIGVVIKLDVGGVGSRVLTPILRNVPVLNKILPGTSGSGQTGEEYGGYTDLKAAVEQIKALELELEAAQSGDNAKDERIAQLQAEVARLQEFADKQVEFQRIQTEFYEEVIYAEKGPGAAEYRKYYEEMDPATAEYLYKQVVVQEAADAAASGYAKTYSSMEPEQAAAIFESMTDDLDLVADILDAMSVDDRARILGSIGETNAELAARLTKIMAPVS
ncbi:MAG: hypothetical protein LBQ15_12240 [Clostridium sp.]|jgi:flagellar motility protein MotE (MotC chaperone)|nr:hypothetical protein [Clostridium sp.]